MSDDIDRHHEEQEARRRRRGTHAKTCDGYNERPCDCGLVDRIEQERDDLRAALAEALDGWEGHINRARIAEKNAFVHSDSDDGAEAVERSLKESGRVLDHIAELREKFLGGK